MTVTLDMLETYPRPVELDAETLAATIDQLIACAETCTECANACLGEEMVADLTDCIRADLDCADVCAATARVLSRHTGESADLNRTMLDACIVACRVCADECAMHAEMHEHCRICAETCRACEEACRELLAVIG